jgi:hypothetical protein
MYRKRKTSLIHVFSSCPLQSVRGNVPTTRFVPATMFVGATRFAGNARFVGDARFVGATMGLRQLR